MKFLLFIPILFLFAGCESEAQKQTTKNFEKILTEKKEISKDTKRRTKRKRADEKGNPLAV